MNEDFRLPSFTEAQDKSLDSEELSEAFNSSDSAIEKKTVKKSSPSLSSDEQSTLLTLEEIVKVNRIRAIGSNGTKTYAKAVTFTQ